MKNLITILFIFITSISFAQEAVDTLVTKSCQCYENGDVAGFTIEDAFPECVYGVLSRRKFDFEAVTKAMGNMEREALMQLIIKKIVFDCDAAYQFYNEQLFITLEAAVREDMPSLADINEQIEKNREKKERSDDYATRGAVNLWIEKDYEQALEDFNKAIEIGQDNFSNYTFRGLYYQTVGDIEKAVADFEKAVELEGEEPIFPLLLFLAKRKQQELSKKD